MKIKNESKDLKTNKESKPHFCAEKEENLSGYKKEYTVKRTFQGEISKEEMIRTIVQIFLETDTKDEKIR